MLMRGRLRDGTTPRRSSSGEVCTPLDVDTQLAASIEAVLRIGMIDHTGAIILESYVFSHPDNIIDYVSSRQLFLLP